MLKVMTPYGGWIILGSVKQGWAWGQGSQPGGPGLQHAEGAADEVRRSRDWMPAFPFCPCDSLTVSLSLHIHIYGMHQPSPIGLPVLFSKVPSLLVLFEALKWDWCDWGTELKIAFNFNQLTMFNASMGKYSARTYVVGFDTQSLCFLFFFVCF